MTSLPSGNTGLGETNPTAKLEINVSTAVTALDIQGSAGQLFSVTNNLTSGSIFSVNDVSGLPSIDVDADGTIQLAPIGATEFVGVGLTNPTAKLDVAGAFKVSGISSFQNDVTIGASGTTTPAFFDVSTGNFGIGTINPTAKLDVQSTSSVATRIKSNVSTAYLNLEDSATTSGNVAVGAVGNNLLLRAGNSNHVRLTFDGNVGIGSDTPTTKLDVNGGLKVSGVSTFQDDVNIGNVSGVSTFQDDVNIGVGGTTAFFDVSTGNIGIGTDNPTAKLDVNGLIAGVGVTAVGIGTTNADFTISALGTGFIKVNENNLPEALIVTQNDIGTASNEIPLNQYLGTAAFQDSSNFSVGDLQVGTAYTVSGLPASPSVGRVARVTDASSPGIGSIVAGIGTEAALCWYNGTNWTVIGV
jgi:hypothetical protein